MPDKEQQRLNRVIQEAQGKVRYVDLKTGKSKDGVVVEYSNDLHPWAIKVQLDGEEEPRWINVNELQITGNQ